MIRYVVKRLLLAALTLFVISVITFLLFFAVPNNPAEVICGNGKSCSQARIQMLEERFGLNDPIHQQYSNYMKGIFVGRDIGAANDPRHCSAPCLGYSFRYDDEVTDIIGQALPVTLSIVVGAITVQVLFGVTTGMVSALRRGTVFDKAAVGTSLTFASMQIYFLGYVLLILLVYEEPGLLPPPGYTPITENPAAWAGGLLLPWITLGAINSAIYARLSRAQMLETLSEDFVRTARAKGLPKRTVYTRHALRAAITPIVTIVGLDIGSYLGGTVITETVFGMRGLGKFSIDAVEDLDMPIVMATVLLAALFVVVANLVVDLLYTVIDPRVKLG